jgi:hypothetical protein
VRLALTVNDRLTADDFSGSSATWSRLGITNPEIDAPLAVDREAWELVDRNKL